MAVPAEIRQIPRPKNTIVKCYGKNHDKYIVIGRKPSVRMPDGSYRPVNSGTIGHIENGKYVPLGSPTVQNVSVETTDYKTYGCYALCDYVFSDILEELRSVYSYEDALKIYIMAIIRVCRPGIKDHRIGVEYDSSYLSELYPGVPLCKNTVSTFQADLGRTCSKIREFMKRRLDNVKIDHHLIIDGTLKVDDSTVNDLSSYSRKSRLVNRKDISILYAYDFESKEPICSECFPGNEIDAVSYREFLEDNQVTKGIVIADKGFSIERVRDYYRDHPDLHYINPLKRSDQKNKKYNMLEFEDELEITSDGPTSSDGAIYYKKASYFADGELRWLYSFKDVYRAMQEEEVWAREFRKKPLKERQKLSFKEQLDRKKLTFGTITMESDLDLTPEDCYKYYESRWSIELMMRCYKYACEFDTTDTHSDYSIMGSEFINFFSVVLTYRLEDLFQSKPALRADSYVDIMSDLCRIKKIRIKGNEWKLSHILDKYQILMQEVGLIPQTVERKRGRPRSHPVSDLDQPKRKRGRPKGSKNKPKASLEGQAG